MKKFQVHSDGYLDDVLRGVYQQISSKIDGEQESYLLDVNEETYIDHLVSEFTIDPPVIDVDGITVTPSERMISARHHPSTGFFMMDENAEYKRQVLTFHIPFQGELELIRFQPNPGLMWSHEFTHEVIDGGQVLSFEIVNFSNDPEHVKREKDSIVNSFSSQMGNIRNQVNGFNTSLRQEIESRFQTRKKDLLSKSDFLTQLGVPVKKNPNTPETFSVPAVKPPKKIVPRPSVATTDGKLDPTLDLETYNEILQVIHDVGKQLERMPSTYKNKHEEELRDHFLLFLEPKFIGAATGETFNKTGKTDILLRHDGSNIFIAENKFWSGEKNYLETIDQILGYLTWRDSKAAIVLFVKNADFSSVINTVKTATPKHANFVSFEGETEETRLLYRVHLNGDAGRNIYLTVLLFHLPEDN